MALQELLISNAGLDSLQDRYYSGYIAAFNDLLKVEPDFTEESQ